MPQETRFWHWFKIFSLPFVRLRSLWLQRTIFSNFLGIEHASFRITKPHVENIFLNGMKLFMFDGGPEKVISERQTANLENILLAVASLLFFESCSWSPDRTAVFKPVDVVLLNNIKLAASGRPQCLSQKSTTRSTSLAHLGTKFGNAENWGLIRLAQEKPYAQKRATVPDTSMPFL